MGESGSGDRSCSARSRSVQPPQVLAPPTTEGQRSLWLYFEQEQCAEFVCNCLVRPSPNSRRESLQTTSYITPQRFL